ncbi:MAG: hypothetical protein U0359_21370 [Byssovorax sp.]
MPEKEPTGPKSAAPLSVSAAPSGSTSTGVSQASAPREAPKSGVPTLVTESFEPGKTLDLYPIEGALMVVNALDVGRIVGEKVEWIGKIPDTNQWLGGSQINAVYGAWPDGVDVLYSSLNGRAAQPTIFPLTGPKGSAFTFGAGGGLGWYSGSARFDKSTVVGGYDMTGYHIATIRGPGKPFWPTKAAKMGCTEQEMSRQWGSENAIAVGFRALAATDKGTLVTVGTLCERENEPAAEVWDAPGKSRVIPLKDMISDIGYFPDLLRGKGDVLWLYSNPVLQYEGGQFTPLPRLERPIRNLFVSPEGKLHGISGRAIVRLDEGKWTTIANLAYPTSFRSIAMDEQGTIWVGGNGVERLRPSADADIENGCKTPFVYLYDVSWKNDAKYTYPTTRKALSTFPEVASIKLVEYWEGRRSLGVEVKSKEQGEAVIAHVKANMKDEHPELTCFSPKRNVRVIEMPGK